MTYESFEAMLGDDYVDIRFYRETNWNRDKDYGADADGNRGVDTGWYVEEDIPSFVRVYGEDKQPVSLGEIEAKAVDALIDTYMRENEPEIDDEY